MLIFSAHLPARYSMFLDACWKLLETVLNAKIWRASHTILESAAACFFVVARAGKWFLPRCSDAPFLHYPAATKAWAASIWRRWLVGSLRLGAMGRELTKLFSTA